MSELAKPLELVEKVILETRSNVWVTFSIGGCGIITHVLLGKHDKGHQNARSIALDFAQRVVRIIGISSAPEQVITSHVLVETATSVINDTVTAKDAELVALTCTTWRYIRGELEICSVGANSVLIFEGRDIQEAFTPHSAYALLRDQGHPMSNNAVNNAITHALRIKDGCSVEDIRVVHIPLLPTTTIAILVDRRLTNDILQQEVLRDDLPSFIETWTPTPFGKRMRTSVLISL